jgi:hypothetical protein
LKTASDNSPSSIPAFGVPRPAIYRRSDRLAYPADSFIDPMSMMTKQPADDLTLDTGGNH